MKKATNDVMKIEIQRRLEEAEGWIRKRREEVNEKERQVNQDEESLAMLRKGGFMSLSMTHVCSNREVEFIHTTHAVIIDCN